MRKSLFIIAILCIASICEAKSYVCLDKSTGEPKGFVNIDEKSIGDWAKKFIMIEADKSYVGKQSYEIKYDNQKLRCATKEEITAYQTSKDNEAKSAKKQAILAELGITEADIERLKAIK